MKKIALVLSYAAVALISSSCTYKLPSGIIASDCTAAHGGNPYACWTDLNLDRPRPANGMSYHRAGTMSLAHATCVRAESEWLFHGAHIQYTKQINEDGNQELMSAYRKRYPRVADYLESVGALQTTKWTRLSGRDLNRLGVPLCGNQS